MNKIIGLLLLLFVSANCRAQCVIDSTIVAWGFHPDTGSVIKHACAGSYYEDAIQIFAPENVTVQFGTFPVNYVQLDSIRGLPEYLWYSTNPVSGYMAGGERGCISIFGQVNAPVGVYEFTIYYTANFMFLGAPNSLHFTAPYKIQVDSGNVTYGAITDTTCSKSPYYFNNQWLTTSGSYTDTLSNQAGCDSVVTLTLAVLQIDTAITTSHDTVFAPAGYQNYRLFNCNTGDVISDGADNVLTAPVGCCYAVVMSNQGCADTSRCFESIAVSTGIVPVVAERLALYPGLATDVVTIPTAGQGAVLRVYNFTGQTVIETTSEATPYRLDVTALPAGAYVAELKAGNVYSRGKFVKAGGWYLNTYK